MQTFTRILAAMTCLGALIPGAAAAAPATDPVPWQPYRSEPFYDAPGAVCSFGIRAVPVRDEEEYRTLRSYPDGSPQLLEFRGPLYFRYTNETTGKSVRRNLSGYAFVSYPPGGGNDALFLQHGGTTVAKGNRGFPAGEWVFTGQFRITRTADGDTQVELIKASAENLCRTLA